jgi:hypothetical protein
LRALLIGVLALYSDGVEPSADGDRYGQLFESSPGTSLKYLQSILNVFSAGVEARIFAVREGDSTHSSK